MLPLVCPFDTTPHTVKRSLLQPHHSFLNLGQCNSIFTASVLAGLKADKTILDNGQQCLTADAVDTNFSDRPVLKLNRTMYASMAIGDVVDMASVTLSGFVAYLD